MKNTCILCGNETKVVYTTEPIPVFQGCVDSEYSEGELCRQEWGECKVCGTLQIANPLPPEQIYQAGHASGLGGAWQRHNLSFAEFIGLFGGTSIVEVGGGSCALARLVISNTSSPHYTVVDANPLNTEEIPNLRVIRGLFDIRKLSKETYDTLVFSHCLEHFHELGGIIDSLAISLPRNGRVVISYPQQANWLKRGLAGAVNWEHSHLVDVSNLITRFCKGGFALVEQSYFEDHSYFLSFVLEERDWKNTDSQSYNKTNLSSELIAYYLRQEQLADEVSDIATNLQKVVLAPASVFNQVILARQNQRANIHLLDNSTLKQGKRLYGTRYIVQARDQVLSENSVYIVNAGYHSEEMAQQAFAEFKGIAIFLPDANSKLVKYGPN